MKRANGSFTRIHYSLFVIHYSFLILLFSDENLFHDVALADGVHNVLTFNDFSENGVVTVEPRRGDVRDEKLRTVRVWAGVCH